MAESEETAGRSGGVAYRTPWPQSIDRKGGNSMGCNITRKDFIKGAGSTVIAAGAIESSVAIADERSGDAPDISLSRIGSAAIAEAEFKAIEVDPDAPRSDYDVVVVGGGTSGVCATLSAAQSGAKVALVERTDSLGGLSRVSNVVASVGCRQQIEAGFDYTVADVTKFMTSWYHHTNDLSVVNELASRSGETIDWLEDNGVVFVPLPKTFRWQPYAEPYCEDFAMMFGANEGVTSFEEVDNGARLTPIIDAIEGHENVDVMVNTRAVKLIKGQGDSEVEAVICQREDGSQVRLNAKAVVLAAGSWSGSTDYFREVIAHNTRYMNNSNTGLSVDNSGDGIYLAEEIGGWGFVSCPHWHQIVTALPDGTPSSEMSDRRIWSDLRYDPHLIWVNAEGTRFCSETVSGSLAQRGSVVASQGGDMWVIYDRGILEDIEANGSIPSAWTTVSDVYNIKAGSGYLEMIEEDVAEGRILRADTLEELGEMCGFDADEFALTMRTYNESVDAKHDALFQKDPEFLSYKYENPPFYAQRQTANNEGGALGGLRVNRKMRVYNIDTRKTFKNLFAAGYNASGFFGLGSYADMVGLTMGTACTGGRTAGLNAAEVALSM